MIISASYRTDIPTFYGTWFMNRLRAGFCRTHNPYNRQPIHIPLTRDVVDGFVFWTKNLIPFQKHLPEVHRLGYPFVIQYGINNYPRDIETAVTDASRSLVVFRQVAETYGPRVCVWRYDPIITTSLTPLDFHRRNFAQIARSLDGATDEVVISFAQFYRKTNRNLSRAAESIQLAWSDPSDEQKCALVTDLVAIAHEHGMRLTLCSQPQYRALGAGEAACVDAVRLSDVAGRVIAAKTKGNRPDCRCSQSRDIGAYDTCPQGCVYCYAVASHQGARSNHRLHDPESPFLFK